ncbi:hypothetical protein [Campylobacter canadensis]|uniref:hypothetical protein n=1 Tax=Campylobacter canadensis TaxID=449520 RepID=UPI001CCA8AEA|nr:hypothetical protein [Campylobacter canadensis]MBZ8002655.1 hypothetical protein [Campylobacter canadensis]
MISDDFINDFILEENLKKKTFKIQDNLYIRFEKTTKVFDFKMSYQNRVYFEKINEFDYQKFRIKDAIVKALEIKANIIKNNKIDYTKLVKIAPNKSKNQNFTRTLRRKKFYKIDKMIYNLKYIDKIYKFRINDYLIVKVTKKYKTFIFNYTKSNNYYNFALGWFSADFLYKDAMRKVEEIKKDLNI